MSSPDGLFANRGFPYTQCEHNYSLRQASQLYVKVVGHKLTDLNLTTNAMGYKLGVIRPKVPLIVSAAVRKQWLAAGLTGATLEPVQVIED